MASKRKSKIRNLPVEWQGGDAWRLPVQVRPPAAVPPESYFIGMLGLGASLTSSLPPIILTEKTSPKYELKHK